MRIQFKYKISLELLNSQSDENTLKVPKMLSKHFAVIKDLLCRRRNKWL